MKRYRVKIYAKNPYRKILGDTRVNAKNTNEALRKAKKKCKVNQGAFASVWQHPHTLIGHRYEI